MWIESLSLYPVAEERRKYDGRTDDEQAGSYDHHNLPCDAFFPRIHLDVDLQAGIDGDNGCDGIEQVKDIQHHGYHIVVHKCQRVCAPTVVYAAAFGGGGQGNACAKQQACQLAHPISHFS